MIRWFGALAPSTQIILSIILITVIGIFDEVTGVELSFSIFYFLPIVMASWFVGIQSGVGMSLLATGLWAWAEYQGGSMISSSFVFTFNVSVRLGMFLIIAFLIARLRSDARRLHEEELLSQKSFSVITTSQELTSIIAQSVTAHTSNLSLWLIKQKRLGQKFPPIIEETCRKVGANLAILTEICFQFQPVEKGVDLDKLMDALQERLNEVNTEETHRRTQTVSRELED